MEHRTNKLVLADDNNSTNLNLVEEASDMKLRLLDTTSAVFGVL
jgi:hypothetical protein